MVKCLTETFNSLYGILNIALIPNPTTYATFNSLYGIPIANCTKKQELKLKRDLSIPFMGYLEK